MSVRDVILMKILLVSGKDYNSYTRTVLNEMYNDIRNLQASEFSYNNAMWIVDSKTPTKLDGEFIDLAKAIRYLKELMREVKKNYIL